MLTIPVPSERFFARFLFEGLPKLHLIIKSIKKFPRRLVRLLWPFEIPADVLQIAKSGISIIIPERENPELLEECLNSVLVACRRVKEPVEIIVVVNGSDLLRYSKLKDTFTSVQWLFFERPLWFTGAIYQGLIRACHDWVYLLNDDMVLDPMALCELLDWRGSHIFAIASQIYFKDPDKRREETGWTHYRIRDEVFEIFDQQPDETGTVRGTLYAGGGSSLYQRKLLLRIMGKGNPYSPFYWEDVEWGTVAWKLGFESLFCPASKVWHSHRATYRRLFAEEEIDRIFRRNGCLFQLRNPLEGVSARLVFRSLTMLDLKSVLELLTPGTLVGIWAARLRSLRYPFQNPGLQYVVHKYYQRPTADLGQMPIILVVTPYAIYPPSHGGAVRLHRLLLFLSRCFNVIVLSDEVEAYSADSCKYFTPLASIHLVDGRREQTEASLQRIRRIKSHSHALLEEQLRMLITSYQPVIVQVEFMELAGLVKIRDRQRPWFLTLHDVLISNDCGKLSKEDRYELDLIQRYDQVITCSHEDAQLLEFKNSTVIPNGIDSNDRPYVASRATRVLFIGPFRYSPNLNGIRMFLEEVYPTLKHDIPELELWVLGGQAAPAVASRFACFQQQGVTVFDFIENTRPILEQCTLTINPLLGVRGSCLKVIESLAAGRVCVSTREGARGFLDSSLPSLLVVEAIQDFMGPLEEMLLNPSKRICIEQLSEETLARYCWEKSGQLLVDLYRHTVGPQLADEMTSAGFLETLKTESLADDKIAAGILLDQGSTSRQSGRSS